MLWALLSPVIPDAVTADVDGRELVIIEATRKAHRDAARRARTTLPVGAVVTCGGVALTLATAVLPVGFLLVFLIAVFGVIVTVFGLTLVGRSVVTLIEARRALPALEPPRAVIVERRAP